MKSKIEDPIVPLLEGTVQDSEKVQHLLAPKNQDLEDDALDEDLDRENALVQALIGERGGLVLATGKLRVLLSRMRDCEDHLEEAETWERQDYELAASALLDLLSIVH